MDFSTYQKNATKTAIYPKNLGIIYNTLGLTNEAGEVAGKIKKIIRGDSGSEITKDKKEDIKKELGDVLWYLSQLATELEISLDDIATTNLVKLANRQQNGTIKGSGDNR